MRKVLESRKTSTSGLDLSLIAYAIQLPDMLTLSQEMEIIDPDRLHLARKHVQGSLAIELFSELQSAYLDTQGPAAYVFSPEEVSRRRLRNTCLAYLTSVESKAAIELAYTQFVNANCMSDKISALSSLASTSGPEREKVLQQFFTDAAGDALVINKWFGIQAMADRKGLLNDVKQLKSHPDFTMTNPNRARSLISVFAGNMPYFHAQDGKGYEFIADCVIEIDKCNPQVAARMAGSFSQWRRFDTARQTLMQQELNRILSTQGLSKDTYEVCSRTLN
jgi:aminopeptidase N